MRKTFKNEMGITLIALVITIIVLLILAGISIGAITSDNGIIKQSQSAKENTEIASEKEILDVSSVNAIAKDRRGNITKDNLDPELDSNIGKGKYESVEIDEGVVVTFTESNRSYLVNTDGNVESFDIVKDETPWELAGSGTEEDPYLIESIEDLVQFSNNVNVSNYYSGKYVKLMVTLNFNSSLSYCDPTTRVSEKTNRIIEKDDSGTAIKTFLTSGKGFNPIGKGNGGFRGNFDGNDNEVRNIYINRAEEDKVGLFGQVSGGSQVIEKLGVSGIIIGNSKVGGIVGTESQAGVIIRKCYNMANVKANSSFVGGIAGSNFGKISLCYNIGKIEGNGSNLGGICGYQNNYELKYCYNVGEIIQTGENSVGGIIGYNNGGKVTWCYNAGKISGNSSIGGIGGSCKSEGSIINCYNISDIFLQEKQRVGGIIGEPSSDMIVKSCYNKGKIAARDKGAGGIIGGYMGEKISTNISECYYLEGTAPGGIYSKDIEGQAEPLEESQMPKVIDVIQNQIEVDGETINVWKEDTENTNNGYPILYWE